jgi:GNAT superfamily N-acetyltransferase
MSQEQSMVIADADAERIEADFMSHYVSSATGPVKSRLGTATMRIGGGVALSMRHDVTGYWSKALFGDRLNEAESPADAEEWASTTLRGFGMPEEGLADMMAASVHEYSHFRPFAAWDGDEMVATANLYLRGEIGSLNSAATLPGHQNQGVQSALVAARAKAAADEGCRWLVAETGVLEEGRAIPP